MNARYEINPRVKKRWFKENEMYYDLVRHSEKEERYSIYEGGIEVIKTEETVFSSKNIEEVITIKDNTQKNNLEK